MPECGMSSRFPILAVALSLLGCTQPLVVRPPESRLEREARALREVTRLGQPGDWLVIRGYHATDHLVSALTNEPFSHVAILDPARQQVIEAEGKGLHTTPLPAFMTKAHRLMLLRPVWATDPARQEAAVARARSLVGSPYDFTGLVGLGLPDRYYCSELAVAVHVPQASRKDRMPPVIPPGDLHRWATILWDSGPVPTR